MKKVTLLIALMGCCIFASAQIKLAGNYQLTIDLSQLKVQPRMIYLWYNKYVDGKRMQEYDSIEVKNSIIRFKGEINEPALAYLSSLSQHIKTRPGKGDFFTFYLEAANQKIVCVDTLSNYTITGGEFGKAYSEFEQMENNYQSKMQAFYPELNRTRGKDSVAFKKVAAAYTIVYNEYVNVASKQFILNHFNSPVSLLALSLYTGAVIANPDAADSVYQKLNPAIKNMVSARRTKSLIDIAKRTNIGRAATDFSQPDTAGKVVNLSAFKGKYVLLDFWASWCGPCRAENPTVVADYNKYKDRNFTVLSVSLDNQSGKMAWLKAIKDDHLEQWTHVSDLKQFDNEAAKLYGVTAIPQNFLIDPDGKIIAKNLRGVELTKKLEELFGKL